MKRESLHDWREVIDLSPYEKKIKSAANKREKQKLRYKTSRQWSKEATNLPGLNGEYAFHLCTGLPIDLGLSKHGDVGLMPLSALVELVTLLGHIDKVQMTVVPGPGVTVPLTGSDSLFISGVHLLAGLLFVFHS